VRGAGPLGADLPDLRGTGRIDRTERRGVSVFPTHAGLLRYLVEQDAELDGNVILELEGEPTGDTDIDADSGAMLVRPVHVVGAHPIDPELVEAVRRRLG
jgi:hypothetical protein